MTGSVTSVLLGVFLVFDLAAEDHPVVAGYERFFAGKSDTPFQAEAGWMLVSELGCRACHFTDERGEPLYSDNPAPDLSDAGDRLNVDWLRRYLSNPQKEKPGNRMPDILAGLSDSVRQDRVEELVHFLASLKGSSPPPVFRTTVDPEFGLRVYNQVGCVACHAPLTDSGLEGSNPDRTVVPLSDLKAKYRNGSVLAQFLLNPHQWRSGGRMPSMNLDSREALSISAAFGLSVSVHIEGVRTSDDAALESAGMSDHLEPGIHWESFRGSWNNLPDFDKLTSGNRGKADRFTPAPANGKDQIGLRQRAYLKVEKEGLYNFYTRSDDGSQLFIGPVMVVDNDGVHGGSERSGGIELKPGRHAITVTYFEQGGGEELSVSWSGPEMKKKVISPDFLSRTPDGQFPIGGRLVKESGFVPDQNLVDKGRSTFRQLGCIHCHSLPGIDKDSRLAEKIPVLGPGIEGGCLSNEPGRGIPFYSLNPDQISTIKAAFNSDRKEIPPDVGLQIHRTMVSFNCYACHERQGLGGPEIGTDSYFISMGEDMGEEGRIAPHLNDAGAKLTLNWLRDVLEKGTKVRPYMATRMPVFGKSAVSHLAEDFKKADGHLVGSNPIRPKLETRDIMRFGRQLIGLKGMGCITCHRFNRRNALGVQAVDLRHVVGRLEREWFSRYLVNPNALRPGTRMPSFWPEGKSVLDAVLSGNSDKQTEAIWKYLEAIPDVPLPQGLSRNEILLAPENGQAVIYRNFIQGAGPRAIGVGYPGEINLAWDANHLRPAVIWKGEFIDASKHWVGRGPGYQSPHGYSVFNLPDGPTLARLNDLHEDWPSARVNDRIGGRFKGMQLDENRRPTFLFQSGSIIAHDFFKPEVADNPFLSRILRMEAVETVENFYYRAGNGRNIQNLGDEVYLIDERLTIRLTLPEGHQAEIRRTSSGMEILVLLDFASGVIEIKQDYHWD